MYVSCRVIVQSIERRDAQTAIATEVNVGTVQEGISGVLVGGARLMPPWE